MPDQEVLTLVTPLYKSLAKDSVTNYRPISLTNHITKAFERLPHEDIQSLANQRLPPIKPAWIP